MGGSVSSALKNSVETQIVDEKVLIYSKSYCPYCEQTKQCLSEGQVAAKIIELDQVNDGAKIQDCLKQLSGQKTVPYVYINGNLIGGNSDLQQIRSNGQLKTILDSANIFN